MPDATYTRRRVMSSLLRGAAAAAIDVPVLNAIAQAGGQNAGRGPFFYTENFQRQFRVPAMSVAVSKGGRFVPITLEEWPIVNIWLRLGRTLSFVLPTSPNRSLPSQSFR